jgi:hypothetical protein
MAEAGRADQWHVALARFAVLAEAASVAASLLTVLVLLVGFRRMDYPYPGLRDIANPPYEVAMLTFLVGIVLLVAWAACSLVRRTAPSARMAGLALLGVLAAFAGQLLVMSQYRHLD